MKPGLPGGRPPDRVPGLPSVHKARADRDRGRFSRASSAFWLWAASGLAVLLIGYRFVSGRELDGAKADLLAKQRADARDVPSVRRASSSSQKDGFVGCLLREPNVAAARGDADAGAFAEQPWNWQKAYGATRILTDEWVAEVKNAPDPLRLKVFDEQYEKAVMSEIPLAIDLVRQAQFFLLVLDEDSDEAKAVAEGGIVSEAVLQRSPHYARVHLYDLRNGKEALSLRRSAEASFVFAGEHGATDPETLDALKRQVNNCALAKEVDRAIAPRPLSASP
jgi:hypothetical protein